MCSIFKYNSCVGRNFDYEISYDEKIQVIERGAYDNPYKVMGVRAGIVPSYPLLYDGMNEHGLCMGGLAFEGNAHYRKMMNGKVNVPSFDFIFEILCGYKSVKEVKEFLMDLNINDAQYSPDFPNSDLHWFIADKTESIIVEQTELGLHFYDGDVMTNNPPYPQQLEMNKIGLNMIKDYPKPPKAYKTRGGETYGLLGDYTSMTRFTRLTYLKDKMKKSLNPFNDVVSSFHLLSSVEQAYGATPVNDKFEYTIYSVVYDMDKKTMYIKRYDDCNTKIKALD